MPMKEEMLMKVDAEEGGGDAHEGGGAGGCHQMSAVHLT